MLRRCPAPLIALTAALALGLGSQPSSSRADGLTSNSDTSNTPTMTLDYTLTANQNIAPASGSPPTQGTPTPQVLATDTPISIVPPPSSSSTGPLQIVADSGGFYYNNPSELLVGVGTTTASDGSPLQALGLTFYGQGLAAGSSLTFSLTFDKAIVGSNPPIPPVFTQIDPTTLKPIADPSVSIKYDGIAAGGSTSTGGGSGSTITTQGGAGVPISETPEPLSLLVWSALAGVGIWRVRGRRRRSSSPR